MSRRHLSVAVLAVASVLLTERAASAQVPQGLIGEWSASINRESTADGTYDLRIVLSDNLLAYTVSGGPSDHQRGIVCSYGYAATYTVTNQGGPSVGITQSVDSLAGRIRKPSQWCYQHYQSIGVVLPQAITLALSADGSRLTINDRVQFSRTVKQAPKVWTAHELNGFIDYYRGLMKIY